MGNKDIVNKLRNEGNTFLEIGKVLGISGQRVQQIFSGYRSPSLIYKRKSKYFPWIKKEERRLGLEEIKEIVKIRKKEKEEKIVKYLDSMVSKEMEDIKNISSLTGMDTGSRDRLRELIRIRDNHTCQMCGRIWERGKRRFDVHHNGEDIDGKTPTMSVDSLDRSNFHRMITLCHKCHFNLLITTNKLS
jgi:predicted transcriptional regulator